MLRAFSLASDKAGSNIDASTDIIAITTSNSTKVKAKLLFQRHRLDGLLRQDRTGQVTFSAMSVIQHRRRNKVENAGRVKLLRREFPTEQTGGGNQRRLARVTILN